MKTRIYNKLTNHLPSSLAVKLDHTLANKEWRARQYAKIRVFIKRRGAMKQLTDIEKEILQGYFDAVSDTKEGEYFLDDLYYKERDSFENAIHKLHKLTGLSI